MPRYVKTVPSSNPNVPEFISDNESEYKEVADSLDTAQDSDIPTVKAVRDAVSAGGTGVTMEQVNAAIAAAIENLLQP